MKGHIAVIPPVEERFGPLGGAIARWISATYPRTGHPVQIVAANATLQAEHFAPLSAGESTLSAALARTALYGQRPAALLSMDGPRLVRAVTGKGRLWLRLSLKNIRGAASVHVHNRPRYALHLRDLGYSGQIVCHMHNDLTQQRLSPSEVTRARREIDYWHFCSDFIRDQAISDFSLAAGKCRTIPNGAVPLAQARTSPSRHSGPILCAGRVAQEKGTHVAVETLEKLHDIGIKKEMIIVGGAGGTGYQTATEYSQRVVHMVHDFNQRSGREYISYAGHQPHEHVLDLMSRASLMLLPCQAVEPFGMVVVEAMGRSTPVLTIAQGGNAEILAADQGGRALTPNSGADELAQAASEMLAPRAWEKYAGSAHIRSQDYTWQRATNALNAAIENELP